MGVENEIALVEKVKPDKDEIMITIRFQVGETIKIIQAVWNKESMHQLRSPEAFAHSTASGLGMQIKTMILDDLYGR